MIERDPEAPLSAEETNDESGFADEGPGEPLPELPGYEVLRRLDSGGQGAVYSAYQTNTGRRVAVKILREFGGDTRLKEERLRREARFLSRLHHPNIVTIHDIGTANNQVFLVTDFVDGVPIDDHVNLSAASIREIVELLVKVCGAMAVAHAAGVIHRDLKPQNIVVDENNQPYVLDFGLAQSLEENLPRLSETDAVVGTVEYLPPERIKGHHPDTRSDVYALGLILYECIADQLPFSGENRAAMLHAIVYDEPLPLRLAVAGEKLNPNTTPSCLSRDLEAVVMKAIARDVDERYQSAADLAADLRRFLDDEPVLARSTSTGYMLRRIVRRYRVHVTAACIVLLMLVGSLVVVTSAWRQADQAYVQTQAALEMAGLLEYGSNERGAGRIEAAVKNFKAAIALAEDNDPDSPVVRERLFTAHQRLAELYFSEGNVSQAREHANRAIEIANRKLPDSEKVQWRSKQAFALLLGGQIAVAESRYDDAAGVFISAVNRFAQLDVPRDTGYNHAPHKAKAQMLAGRALEKAGHADRAVEQYHDAITTYKGLLDHDPANARLALNLATTEGQLASWHLRRNNEADTRLALALEERAIERLEGVTDPSVQYDVARTLDAMRQNRDLALRRLQPPSD